MKLLHNEEVDLFVDAGDEDEVCRVAERLDEEAGLLVKSLDVDDVDIFVDADDEDELCRVVEMFNEEVA